MFTPHFGGFTALLQMFPAGSRVGVAWDGGEPSLLGGGKATLPLAQLLQRENSALSPSCPEPDSANAPSSVETNPAPQIQRDFSSAFSFPRCFEWVFSQFPLLLIAFPAAAAQLEAGWSMLGV